MFIYSLLGLTILIENNDSISFIKLKTNFWVNMEDEVRIPLIILYTTDDLSGFDPVRLIDLSFVASQPALRSNWSVLYSRKITFQTELSDWGPVM